MNVDLLLLRVLRNDLDISGIILKLKRRCKLIAVDSHNDCQSTLHLLLILLLY